MRVRIGSNVQDIGVALETCLAVASHKDGVPGGYVEDVVRNSQIARVVLDSNRVANDLLDGVVDECRAQSSNLHVHTEIAVGIDQVADDLPCESVKAVGEYTNRVVIDAVIPRRGVAAQVNGLG